MTQLGGYGPEQTLIVDTECYRNLWCIGLRRLSDEKTLVMEHSHRRQLDTGRLRNLMLNNRIITYNGNHYDMPMIFCAIAGRSNAELKQANDKIIVGKMKAWHSEEVLGVTVPRDVYIREDGSRSPDGLDHIDLMEPQPNAFAGLKTLMGRMHAKKMQDLPYSPDSELTDEQMDHVISYMGNDIGGTGMLAEWLAEPLALREAFSREYGINLLSKSDAQMGEAIIKKRVEREKGERVYKVETPGGTTFRYPVPAYMRFDRPDLRSILDRLRDTEFMVQHDGKVALPAWLSDLKVEIGDSTYQMGIGGLHSTEANRALHSDEDFALVDFDVASYYPRIIINSGLYPKALGPEFLRIYEALTNERVAAKNIAGDKSRSDAERTAAKVKAEGLKIAVNGCFGKLGSIWSVLYAPHLMIAVTLTGQLALLMLIERAEAMGISVMSGNTDGAVFRIPRGMLGPIVKDRVTEGPVKDLIEQWERDTGFTMEASPYRSIYNRSVNDYIAIKEDGGVKWKGVTANPWRADGGFKPDLRGQLMKNPQMPILANAVVDLILHRTPLEQTIRASRDVRDFVTVVKVDGGATWRGEYLGKVVRYIWAKDGEPIMKAKPHATTGNYAKVSKSDGSRPLMDLPDEFPDDIDHEAYIAAAHEILMDIGYAARPPVIRPLRLAKWSAMAYFAVAV